VDALKIGAWHHSNSTLTYTALFSHLLIVKTRHKNINF